MTKSHSKNQPHPCPYCEAGAIHFRTQSCKRDASEDIDCQAAILKNGAEIENKTKQAHKEECDISYIMKKFETIGQAPDFRGPGSYGDFSDVTDYQTSLNRVIDAQEEFMALPAQIRKRFNNDPAELIEFVNSNDNYEEALKLGLIDANKAQARKGTASKKEASPNNSSEKQQSAP